MSSTIDANRERNAMGQIDPQVHELGMEVLNMTVSGLRWAIFGFNSDNTKIIPRPPLRPPLTGRRTSRCSPTRSR